MIRIKKCREYVIEIVNQYFTKLEDQYIKSVDENMQK